MKALIPEGRISLSVLDLRVPEHRWWSFFSIQDISRLIGIELKWVITIILINYYHLMAAVK